ncbi:hypothetical protein [Janibacter alittae]|uniref:DUF559 domain-containing protein n=1 Tax=Janibacter alittae TaxID=3115209 RepID=A0ABZ2MJD9_9MICO
MLYTYRQLRGERYSRRTIDTLVAAGTLRRAGRFFASRSEDDVVVEALRRGLRPTCLTAAEHHGLWIPPGSGTHVHGRRRVDVPDSYVGHGWHRVWPEDLPVASPALLIEHAARCLDPLDVGILADSALRQGRLHESQLDVIRGAVPRPVRRVLTRASASAESGTESKVRLYFQLRNIPVRAQVEIPGVGRVDLLVGRRWIVELDSRAHHTGESGYEYDRERDGCALQLGYFTTRLTHTMVFGQWGQTQTRLAQITASRQHLLPPERWIRSRRA